MFLKSENFPRKIFQETLCQGKIPPENFLVFENFKTCRERRGQAAKSMPTPTHVGRGVGATPPTPRGGRRVEAKSMPRSKSIKENPVTEKKGQPGLKASHSRKPPDCQARGFPFCFQAFTISAISIADSLFPDSPPVAARISRSERYSDATSKSCVPLYRERISLAIA